MEDEQLDESFVGRMLDGKYRIEELLGAGAMGAVYRARQVALDRTVAVKVMSRRLARDAEFVARFHREAKTASRLWHPNTVSVTDFGEAPDGLLYLVMELVPGRNLERVIQEDYPLSEGRVANITSQVLSALAAAHDLGIIHRDLKPENLLVVPGITDEGDSTDVVKVCDFGLAKLLDVDDEPASGAVSSSGGAKLTAFGMVLGTPAYMSPEQGAGTSPDARSDLYAVGAILYEMLTQQVPFDCATPEDSVIAHITKPLRDPQELVPCSPALAAVCKRALEKDRDARFQTARAMRAALRRALAEPHDVTVIDDRSLTDRPSALGSTPGSTIPPRGGAEAPSLIPARVPAELLPPPVADRPRRRVVLWGGLALLGIAGAASAITRNAMLEQRTPTHGATLDATSSTPVAVPAVSSEGPSATPLVATPAAVATSAARPVREAPRTAIVARAPSATVASAPIVTPEMPEPPSPPSAVPSAAPPPPALTTAPPAPAPVYVPDRAAVTTAIVSTSGTSRANVATFVSHLSFTDCYRGLLRTVGRAEGGAGTMHLDIDEDGVIRSASVRLPPALASASHCFVARVQQQRLGRPPDTGAATADLALTFEP